VARGELAMLLLGLLFTFGDGRMCTGLRFERLPFTAAPSGFDLSISRTDLGLDGVCGDNGILLSGSMALMPGVPGSLLTGWSPGVLRCL